MSIFRDLQRASKDTIEFLMCREYIKNKLNTTASPATCIML